MTFAKTLASAAALSRRPPRAQAQEANPAVIFDLGGKFDRSFNQASYEGAERFKTETGIEYASSSCRPTPSASRRCAASPSRGTTRWSSPASPTSSAMETVAPEFPDTEFVIIDTVVDQPNVRSVVFNEHEGSYLVGVLAAMASETGKVGFVGGMDIPLIRKFACGYVQGVKATNPDAEVFQNMTGTTGAAWNDPVQGRRARQEPDRPRRRRGLPRGRRHRRRRAAGGGGRGQARDRRRLRTRTTCIPGQVLTSMLKRVDNAVYDAMMDVHNGEWTLGRRR